MIDARREMLINAIKIPKNSINLFLIKLFVFIKICESIFSNQLLPPFIINITDKGFKFELKIKIDQFL